MIVIIDHYSQAPGEKANNRFLTVAQMLAAKGYEVEIVTTDFAHIPKKHRCIPQEMFDALPYRYTTLHEPGYKKNVSFSRIFSHTVFGKNLRKYLYSRNDIDCVYISVPSLDVGKVAADYCRDRKIPFYVDIQDIWPEAFEMVLPFSRITKYFLLPLKIRANYVYRSADYIFAVSETYLARGLKNNPGKDGASVFLGTDLASFDSKKEKALIEKPENEIWIGYAGTLGASYNIDIAVNALRLLKAKGIKNVRFKVMGDGPDLERLKKLAEGLPVDFLGRLDYGEMVGILSSCDIAVNPIVHHAPQSIINKHGDYAAAGLPVVSTQESPEYRTLLDKYHCGLNCAVDNTEEFSEAIGQLIGDREKREQMGASSRKMAEDLFDRAKTYQIIVQKIEDAVREIKN